MSMMICPNVSERRSTYQSGRILIHPNGSLTALLYKILWSYVFMLPKRQMVKTVARPSELLHEWVSLSGLQQTEMSHREVAISNQIRQSSCFTAVHAGRDKRLLQAFFNPPKIRFTEILKPGSLPTEKQFRWREIMEASKSRIWERAAN